MSAAARSQSAAAAPADEPSAADAAHGVALIADIVGSRELADRACAQRAILEAFEHAHADVLPLRGAWWTAGDEFQALYATWQDAARATLRVALALPEDVALRFGLGAGTHWEVEGAAEDDAQVPLQDGEAWPRARQAVEAAERRAAGLSTAFVGPDAGLTAAVDSHLQLRDHIVRRLKARERRLAARLLDGATQAEAAAQERITQSAVSQALTRSGAAQLLEVDAALASARKDPAA